MKRVVITLTILFGVAGIAYACNNVSVGYSRVGAGACYHAAATVQYAAPVSYAAPVVSVVSPYTPQVSLPAVQYQQVQVAAPAAYEPAAVAAPVAAPAASVSYATVAAPAYTVAAPAYSVGVGASYARVNVGVGHVGYGNMAAVRVNAGHRVAVRAAPAVVKVRVNTAPRRGLLGRIAERLRARRG